MNFNSGMMDRHAGMAEGNMSFEKLQSRQDFSSLAGVLCVMDVSLNKPPVLPPPEAATTTFNIIITHRTFQERRVETMPDQ